MRNGFVSFLVGVDSFAVLVSATDVQCNSKWKSCRSNPSFFYPQLCPQTSLVHHRVQKNEPCQTRSSFCVAEREGFEPPEPLSSTVFKTAAIDHSAISPTHAKHAFFKIGCKGTTKNAYTQIFWGKNVFLSKKSAYLLCLGNIAPHKHSSRSGILVMSYQSLTFT